MKKLLSRFSLATPVLLLATPASAHPSGHTELTMKQIVSHLLASPYHTGMVVSALVAIAFIIWKVSQTNKSM